MREKVEVAGSGTTVDLRPGNNLLVRVHASLNMSTGLLTWRFTSLDPTTHQPPTDPSAGFFLPPGGVGSVFFTVMPKQSLATNTQIQNQATIVFDVNPPMSTQTWLNTLDNDTPISHVLPLPAVENAASFTVQWAGTDVGSGIQDFTIFVSENGGAFTPFLSNTTDISATFTGQTGKSYAFYSIARDQVGNQEDPKTAHEATTQVAMDTIPPTTTASASPSPNANGWNNTTVTVTLSAVDNPGGSGVKQLQFSLAGASSGTQTVIGSSAAIAITNEGVTTLTYFATDKAGNQEASKTLTVQIDTTPPVVTATQTPAPNANSWNNTDVTVTGSGTDGLSGIDTCTSTTRPAEGAGQTVTVGCTDKAGNSTSVSKVVHIDKTPPTLTCSTSPTPNANGWNKTDVTVSFTASDGLSEIATAPSPVLVTTEGANQPIAGTATDKAGNSASTTCQASIDKTPPTIAGMPAPGCTLWPPNHTLVQVATETASDALSGVASFDVQGTSSEPPDADGPDIVIAGSGVQPHGVQLRAERAGNGPGRIYTVTAIASDRAGNLAQTTATCTVPHDQRK